MLIVNFAHPLTSRQLEQLAATIGGPVGEVRDVRCQADPALPFDEQAGGLIRSVGWSGNQWQTQRFIVNLPGLAPLAAALLAAIHGVAGYFPAIIRLKSAGGTPPEFILAEIVDLGMIREKSRMLR